MRRYDPTPQQYKTLREALEKTGSDEILKRIRWLPGNPKVSSQTRKDERMKILTEGLQGETLKEIWACLTKNEKIVVTALTHSPGGIINQRQVTARYGPGVLDPDQKNNADEDAQLTDRLLLLVYPAEGYFYAMPAELQERLREFVPPFPEESVAAAEALPESVARQPPYSRDEQDSIETPLTRRGMEIAAQHDLIVALRLVSQGGMSVSVKTAQATAASVRKLAALLHEGDFFDLEVEQEEPRDQKVGAIRAYAWPWLLQAAKLASRRGSKLELSKTGHAALAAPPHETLKSLYEAWIENDLLDEFNRVNAIRGQQGKGKRGMTDAHFRRIAIAGALCECPEGEWVRFDELSRFMQADEREFEVTNNPWTLYISEMQYGSLGYSGYHGWHVLQDRYMLCFLFEYLATLGLIDVAYTHPHFARQDFFLSNLGTVETGMKFLSRYDGLEYFRVNALGRYCLHEEAETYRPSRPSARSVLTVFPNRGIQVSGTLSADEKLLLETYAVQEAEDLWRLDGGRILSALEAGHDVERLREFLALRDEQELPERVDGFLQDIQRCAHALELKGTALLIECASAEIADRIAFSRQARKLCERAGESGLVVRVADEDKFKKAIRALGYGMPVT